MWINFSKQDVATICAALLYWQREGLNSSGHEIEAIATNGGEFSAYDGEVVGVLCKQISDGEKQSASDKEKVIRKLARDEWLPHDEIEIDEDACVSLNDDGGAWVQAWLYLPVEACPDCGAIEGTEAWGTVGDGYDGKCPGCADKAEK